MKNRNYNPSRRGNYKGKYSRKHSLTYWLSDILFGLSILAALIFAISVFNSTHHYTDEETQQIAANISTIEESIGNPSEWHILSVSSDYSEAQILVANGEVHLYTVYAATDNEVIININGELHSFAWSRG